MPIRLAAAALTKSRSDRGSLISSTCRSGLARADSVVKVASLAARSGQLAPLSRRIQDSVARSNPTEALKVMEIFSRRSMFDEGVALASAVALLPHLPKCDSTLLIRSVALFAKFKVRPPVLVKALMNRVNEGGLSLTERLSLFENFVYLGIPCENLWPAVSEFSGNSVEISSQLNRLAFSAAVAGRDGLVVEAVEKVFEISGEISRFSEKMKILQVRAYLRYLSPKMYQSLSENSRESLRILQADFDAEPLRKKIPCVSVEKVSECLRKLKIGFTTNLHVGPFPVDIKERDRKIIWEFSGRAKFFAGECGAAERLPVFVWQERVLHAMGYRTAVIPFWQFDRVREKKARIDIVRSTRWAVTGGQGLTSPSPKDSIVSFDAKRAADEEIERREFKGNKFPGQSGKNIGETYFVPEKMTRPWSWNRHRLDEGVGRLVL